MNSIINPNLGIDYINIDVGCGFMCSVDLAFNEEAESFADGVDAKLVGV